MSTSIKNIEQSLEVHYPIASETIRHAVATVLHCENALQKVTADITAAFKATSDLLDELHPNWTKIKMNGVGKDLQASFVKIGAKADVPANIVEEVWGTFRACKDMGTDQTWQSIQRKSLYYEGSRPTNPENPNHPDNKEKEDAVEETAFDRVEKVCKVLVSQLQHLENWEGEVDSDMEELKEGLNSLLNECGATT